MSEEIVRCPYCVLGNEFRPMVRRSTKWFICFSCGHLATASALYTNCACSKCQEMNRIASRCRGSEELRRGEIADLPVRF
jgi:phage FluMu protein Com